MICDTPRHATAYQDNFISTRNHLWLYSDLQQYTHSYTVLRQAVNLSGKTNITAWCLFILTLYIGKQPKRWLSRSSNRCRASDAPTMDYASNHPGLLGAGGLRHLRTCVRTTVTPRGEHREQQALRSFAISRHINDQSSLFVCLKLV